MDRVLELAFDSPEILRRQWDRHLCHRRLLVRSSQPVPPDTRLQVRLVLPPDGAELLLEARVVESVRRPAGAEALYAVRLELLLDAESEGILRTAAGAPPSAGAPLPRPAAAEEPPDDEVDALLERREGLPPPEPATAEQPPPEPEPTRLPMPEEVAQELTDFTLEFVRSVTKSSYYTSDHLEAGKAKAGIYRAFQALVGDRPEVTFYARRAGEKYSILVYGIFDEPADLSKAMLRSTADLYIPKISRYFEANGLLSISFKRALSEEEFHLFVDLLANPAGHDRSTGILQRLAESRIHNISVVVEEDRVAARGLSWRVEMALTRLKKDLSVIPLYKHLSKEELRQVRLTVFRDVVRPLGQTGLIRELLENCDRVIESVGEFSVDQLAEMEAQLLAAVPPRSLPKLLEGLVDDVADAKRESEVEMERLLRLTRRVAKQLRPEQTIELENAFRVLLQKGVLALEEFPTFLQRKFTAERDADSFLRLSRRVFARFDRESSPEKYAIYLDLFERILPELLRRPDPSAANDIVAHVVAHRSGEPPFEGRPMSADTWLQKIVHSSLSEALVGELAKADKLKRESLMELCRSLGDETVPLLFRALIGCENPATRNAISDVLAELEDASRAYLRSALDSPELPTDPRVMLDILSRVGGADCVGLVVPALEHGDPAVRIEALRTAAVLDPGFGDEQALAALEDADRKVRETALKALFDRRCPAPALFDHCERILGDLDAHGAEAGRLVCSGLAAYEGVEGRARAVALLRATLGELSEEGSGWWSSIKRTVKREATHVPVRVAACQALGRLRAAEASEALEGVRRQSNPTLKRAAEHALERIREG